MNEARLCYRCKTEKPRDQFSAGVRDFMCRPCRKEYDTHRKGRASCSNHSDAARARKRRWQEANGDPHKEAARKAVRNAVQAGRMLRKLECEECGISAKRVDGRNAIQAHHDDYDKPLDVRWLCPKCHTRWHKLNDTAMTGGLAG